MKKEDIIKIIDGVVYYHYDYTDYLYNILNKAIKFVETEYNSYPSSEEWRKALLDILKGSDKE